MWRGQTVAVLGGGPSRSREQVDACREHGTRTVAINDAYRLAPHADLVYFCDRRWYEWHEDDPAFRDHRGIKVTLENYPLAEHGVRCVHNFGTKGVHLEPDGICTGRNSGFQVLNLLLHLRAARALLLGFDMRAIAGRTHWHDGHPIATRAGIYADAMLPRWREDGHLFAEHGLEVVNCTPGSALDVFARMDLADCLLDSAA